MLHLYWNNDSETVAADSAEQAVHYHDVQLGNGVAGKDWTQIPDDRPFPITDADTGCKVTRTAGEWAALCAAPLLVATTYL